MIPRIYRLRLTGRKYLVLDDNVRNSTSTSEPFWKAMVLYTDYNDNREHNDWRVMDKDEFLSRFKLLPEDENG